MILLFPTPHSSDIPTFQRQIWAKPTVSDLAKGPGFLRNIKITAQGKIQFLFMTHHAPGFFP
jgi:hypothetical protein